jgi:hypothetical protein
VFKQLKRSLSALIEDKVGLQQRFLFPQRSTAGRIRFPGIVEQGIRLGPPPRTQLPLYLLATKSKAFRSGMPSLSNFSSPWSVHPDRHSQTHLASSSASRPQSAEVRQTLDQTRPWPGPSSEPDRILRAGDQVVEDPAPPLHHPGGSPPARHTSGFKCNRPAPPRWKHSGQDDWRNIDRALPGAHLEIPEGIPPSPDVQATSTYHLRHWSSIQMRAL